MVLFQEIKRSMLNKSSKFFCLCLLFITSVLQAEELQFPLPRHMLGLELARNHPTSFSLKTYEAGLVQPALEYFFLSRPTWLVGVGAGYKLFTMHEAGKLDSLFTLRQSFSYLIRVDYNMHVGLGVEWLYITPTENVSLLPRRYEDRKSQLGAGAMVQLIHQVDDHLGAMLRVSRWRGTADMDLHGFEMAVGVLWLWQ